MRTLFLLSLALLLWSGCETEPDEHRIEFQVDGSVNHAAVVWRDGDGVHEELRAELPWIHAFSAEEGTLVSVTVSSGNTGARLWIRVLEDGEEVRVIPGCLCNGSSVSAQASGSVGGWTN